MNNKKEVPICPVCDSRNITARLKTKTFWCRRCMHIGGREEFFKETIKEKNKYKEGNE